MLLTLVLRLACIALLFSTAALVFDLPWRESGNERIISGVIAVSLALAGAYLGDFLSSLLRPVPGKTAPGEEPRADRRASAPSAQPEEQPARKRRQGSGVIRWYGTDNYGFITSDEDGEEIFFHLNDMPRSQRDKIRPLLREGQAVRFQARQTERGWRAQNLQIVVDDETDHGDAQNAGE